MSRRFFGHLVVGVAAAAALLLYAVPVAVALAVAVPLAFAADKILTWARPHLAALGDTVERWFIRHLTRDSPGDGDFSMHRGLGLGAPQTGTPQVTAFG